MDDFVSYPSTPHVEGSGLQKGDGPPSSRIPYDRLAEQDARDGVAWVLEEKLDGAQAGLSHAPHDLSLRLQSRGSFLTGAPREFQFNMFKEWAAVHEEWLLECLEDRYVCFGEWTFAMHTQFYDRLGHYFHEFDVWDRKEGCFLSTEARQALWGGMPVCPVPVIASGPPPESLKEFRRIADRPSAYRTPDWRDALREAVIDQLRRLPKAGEPDESAVETAWKAALARTGDMDRIEGLYVKREKDGRVIGRFKHVDPQFVQTILDSGDHWMSHRLIRQRLAPGVDIFATPRPQAEPGWG